MQGLRFYLHQLATVDWENAFHLLREAGPEALPGLASALASEPTADVRARLTKVAAAIGGASAIPVLESALGDSAEQVWQSALDGLVSIGGHDALAVVDRAVGELAIRPSARKSSYLREARIQLHDTT